MNEAKAASGGLAVLGWWVWVGLRGGAGLEFDFEPAVVVVVEGAVGVEGGGDRDLLGEELFGVDDAGADEFNEAGEVFAVVAVAHAQGEVFVHGHADGEAFQGGRADADDAQGAGLGDGLDGPLEGWVGAPPIHHCFFSALRRLGAMSSISPWYCVFCLGELCLAQVASTPTASMTRSGCTGSRSRRGSVCRSRSRGWRG